MLAVDTNVLVRLITRDNPAQVEIAEAYIQKGVWVSHLVLAEAAWVLREIYNVGHQEVIEAIDRLLLNTSLTIHDSEVVTAALDQYRRRPRLGFSDCLVLEIARKAGHLPLGTFDHDLSKLDGAQRL
jgi:predicted nucleic-acid-binding protein